jgi:hypothetical protein
MFPNTKQEIWISGANRITGILLWKENASPEEGRVVYDGQDSLNLKYYNVMPINS